MDKTNLPPLPEETEFCDGLKNFCCPTHWGYTAEQMHEYAARAVREAVPEIRAAVADYMGSEGCRCCEGDDHDDHEARLAELLSVPKYDDDSGYDFGKFRTVAPTPDQEPTP